MQRMIAISAGVVSLLATQALSSNSTETLSPLSQDTENNPSSQTRETVAIVLFCVGIGASLLTCCAIGGCSIYNHMRRRSDSTEPVNELTPLIREGEGSSSITLDPSPPAYDTLVFQSPPVSDEEPPSYWECMQENQ